MAIKKKYSGSRNKKTKPIRLILSMVLFFCLLIALVYFLIWSPYFWIQEFEIQSEKNARYFESARVNELANQVLEEKMWGAVPLKSPWLFLKNKLKELILIEFSGIESVEIEFDLPNQAIIQIKQRKKQAIWCQAKYEKVLVQSEKATSTDREIERIQERKLGDCFEIDSNGIIFNASALIRGNMILNIYSQAKNPSLGKKVLSSKATNFILKAYQELKKFKLIQQKKLGVSQFEVFSQEDIRAETKYGWKIYFNPEIDLADQINALARVLNEEVKDDYLDLEYMDLSIKGRVYYK